MEHTPQISVLVTSYNREDTLAASLESVLASSFGDFEVLVVDNQSTDGSVEVARRYERLDRRVRVHVNEANLGQFGNRNRAAALARAPFLKYHDSDDLMYPHCLATLLGPLRAEPRAGFALSSGTAWPGGPCPMLSTPLMSYRREFLGLGMFQCGPAGALFRAEVFHRLGGFEDRGAASDYLFWMRACRTVSVLLMPADLFWYRIHPGQELQSPKSAASYALAHGEAWRALQAPDCPLQGEELQQARRNWAWNLFKITYRDLRSSQWGNAWLRLRSCGVSPADGLRYLRRPKRHFNAGTPLDVDGGYQIPDWTQFDLAGEPVSSERG
ncbi:MAG TPA: glycosyltransferase family A protein [Thermoanaerobaculia bacterium]|nr:glycosyltransferase family A protein [Thermoanaerobaculia bacterium]